MMVALSFMLFVLIYIPCIGTLGSIRVETGNWLWALFACAYTIVLAWIVSFVAYQSLKMGVWQEVVVGLIVAVALWSAFRRAVCAVRKRRCVQGLRLAHERDGSGDRSADAGRRGVLGL